MRTAQNLFIPAISTCVALSSLTPTLTRMLGVIFRPTFNFLYTINTKGSDICRQISSVFSRGSGRTLPRTPTQPWPKWVLFLDCREYSINPEAAISNANLNLRGESAKRWLITSLLASGGNVERPFYGWPKVGGHIRDLVLKRAQRDKCITAGS